MKKNHTEGGWDCKGLTVSSYGFGTICKVLLPQDGGCINAVGNAKVISAAPDNLEDNIEWVAIHEELLKSGIKISKKLSDRIMEQALKSRKSIEKATK